MKARGIIMSEHNPTLILRGRKWMTRRLLEPQPQRCHKIARDSASPSGYSLIADMYEDEYLICPHGSPGDLLYVRENARLLWEADGETRVQYQDGGDFQDVPVDICSDTDEVLFRWIDWQTRNEKRWKPSIHVPRWASRIWLSLLELRIERLQEITEEDAEAEGAEKRHDVFHPEIQSAIDNVHIRNFAALWDRLHGKGSWKSNPFVWVEVFRKLTSVEVQLFKAAKSI